MNNLLKLLLKSIEDTNINIITNKNNISVDSFAHSLVTEYQ